MDGKKNTSINLDPKKGECFRYPDSPGNFDKPTDQSPGFKKRRTLFLNGDGSEFSTDWIQLTGRIHMDLDSLNTGILPGILVEITLDYSTNDFRLFSGETNETFPNNDNVVIEIGAVRWKTKWVYIV